VTAVNCGQWFRGFVTAKTDRGSNRRPKRDRGRSRISQVCQPCRATRGEPLHIRARKERRPASRPWQLHAHAGDAEGSGVMVADQPAGKADQDRRQGGQPRPLRYLPIGRGLGVAADVCGNLVADWPVARPARASVSGGEVICDERRRQRSALMRAKRRVPAPRRSHPAVSTASLDAALVYRCPRRTNRRSCAPQPPGIRGMSD
jgi:hypothetical protein